MSVQPFISTTFSGKAFLSYLNELRALVGEKSVLMVLRKSGWLGNLRSLVSTKHEKITPCEVLVAVNKNIEEIFGETALRTVVYNAAKMSFRTCYGDAPVVKEARTWIQTHQESPLRLRASLETIAYMIEATSDQKVRMDESSSHYHIVIQDCIACWGLEDQHSRYCYYNVGIIRGGLHYLFGRDDYPVQELACITTGDQACEFIVRKFPFSENERGSGKTGFLSLPAHLR